MWESKGQFWNSQVNRIQNTPYMLNLMKFWWRHWMSKIIHILGSSSKFIKVIKVLSWYLRILNKGNIQTRPCITLFQESFYPHFAKIACDEETSTSKTNVSLIHFGKSSHLSEAWSAGGALFGTELAYFLNKIPPIIPDWSSLNHRHLLRYQLYSKWKVMYRGLLILRRKYANLVPNLDVEHSYCE